MADLNDLIAKQDETFGVFQSAILKQKEEISTIGRTSSDTAEKLTKTNEALDKFEKQIAEYVEKTAKWQQTTNDIIARLGRPGDGGGKSPDLTRDAFMTFARSGFADGELLKKDMSSSVGSEGGFLVPETLAAQINSVVFDMCPMRQLANVVTIGTSEFRQNTKKTKGSGGWVSEKGTRSETTAATFGSTLIPVHELYAMPEATSQFLADAQANIEGWLIDAIGGDLAEYENDAFTTGAGVGKPKGILGYTPAADSGYAWGAPGYIASGAAGDWAASTPAANVLNLIYALATPYHSGASFMAPRALIGELRSKVIGTDTFLFQPAGMAGGVPTFAGFPVYENPDLAAKGSNSYSMVFGNWQKAYTIVDRVGISVLRDPYTSKGSVLFYTSKRVGGDVTNFEAYKVMKFAAS